MTPTLFDKLIAVLAFGAGVWLIFSFAQELNSTGSGNYLLPVLAVAAFWLVYWIFSPEKKTADDQNSVLVEIEQIPALPRKSDSSSMYVDDARIVDQINCAIDLADQENWQESEKMLQGVESVIEDWQPYDTSDSYYEMTWGGEISQIRHYIEYHSSSSSTNEFV